jgi:hypothetical protein
MSSRDRIPHCRVVWRPESALALGDGRPPSQDSAPQYITLILDRADFQVSADLLRRNSDYMLYHPNTNRYTVQTPVSPQAFLEFLHAVAGESDLSLTPANLTQLSSLCDEFGVERLKLACDQFARDKFIFSEKPADFRLEPSGFRLDERVSTFAAALDELRREFEL